MTSSPAVDPLDMDDETYTAWCKDQDDQWANLAAEHERDHYLTRNEEADTRETETLL